MHTRARPLLEHLPSLAARLPFVALGDYPTPVQPLDALTAALGVQGEAWVKRDDLSSAVYGGNKVRTLEVLFADAIAKGARRIIATGAFGTNHGVATLLHAPRVGLEPSCLLFPQPPSEAALENFRVLASHELHALPHWSALPLGMLRERRASTYVMAPGGATPIGALGYVSAAFELAEQVASGALPPPRAVVVGVGSTCTTAGLLVGLHLATRLGLGLHEPPMVVAVRVTPWPVTSRLRILELASRASALLVELSGDPRARIGRAALGATLEVDGAQLGAGYGEPTSRGHEAIALFQRTAGFALDTTYSGKAAASLLARLRRGAPGPTVFWSTKSTAPLPPGIDAPRGWLARTWMRRAQRAR